MNLDNETIDFPKHVKYTIRLSQDYVPSSAVLRSL